MAGPSSPPLDVLGSHAPFSLRYPPGHRIAGKYQLIRTLDAGGMGVVWVAHHLDLDVQVALKVVRAELGASELTERLLREAQSAARIDHPAVVRVLDTGLTQEGDPFLVMELLAGEPLAKVIERERRLDPVAAVRTLLPVVGGVAAIHARSMIHRDLKPENIYLARDDSGGTRPKIIDFGVAHVGATRITQPGMVMGTPAYMAPEQLQGGDPDSSVDVWSLAAVLYEAVTGARPFAGESYIEILTLAIRRKVAPLATHGVHEPDLWAIIERGFARVPADRPSAREFGRALALWLWERGVIDDVSGTSLRSTWLGDDDVRRAIPRSQVQTARFPYEPPTFLRRPRQSSQPPPPSAESAPRITAAEPSLAPALSSTPPDARAPADSRRAALLTAFFSIIAVTSLALAWWRVTSVGVAPAAPVSAPPPPPSAAPTPTIEAPAVSAAPPAPPVSASASVSASVSAPRPRVPPPVTTARPGPQSRPPELKNPYH